MPIELIGSLIVSLFAVGYTPGPANIYALSCSLTHGRKKAMKAWLGMLCGFVLDVLIVAVAAHYAGLAMGKYVFVVKYFGAAYILYLAWKTYRASLSEKEDVNCGFWDGFLIQLTNAKMILFDLTIFSTFVLPYSECFVDLLPVAALLLIAGPCANLFWILAGSFLRPIVEKNQRAVDVCLALALVVCAIMIIIK